ncbi:MAG TPA: hypothetical protein PLS55_08765 [Thermogutta sp.]|nr:hypothetical protein [Thermogutta sp.]
MDERPIKERWRSVAQCLLDVYRESGMGVRAFLRWTGIKAPTFYRIKRRQAVTTKTLQKIMDEFGLEIVRREKKRRPQPRI